MATQERMTLRQANEIHKHEWVVMQLSAGSPDQAWEREGVVLFHGSERDEAHAAAKAQFDCISDKSSCRLAVFQASYPPTPGDEFRMELESIYYAPDLDPVLLEL